MSVLRRRKRDSATNIYRHCIRVGNCPQDVKNKIENTTIADKILTYGSGAVFFGGLGISTGSKGGTALEATVGPGVSVGSRIPTRPLRPTGPVDVGLGIRPTETPFQPPSRAPIDIDVGVGHVEPTDPSIIVPVDVAPDVVDEVITLPMPEITIEGGTTAIIEVTPRAPDNTLVSRTQYSNPAFDISLFSDSPAGELSASDEVTIRGGGGIVVGRPSLVEPEGEEIELVEFSRVSRPGAEEQEETSFRTSTPEGPRAGTRTRARTRAPVGRGLYSRGVEQIRVEEPEFLTQPGRLVQFDYTNPAYDPDITEIFEQDVADAAAGAPSFSFRDVVRLGRQIINRRRSGLLRVSRLGQRSTISTRSGLRIGARTHFYTDLSPITATDAVEEIELQEFSNQGTMVNMMLDNAANEEAVLDELLDDLGDTESIGSHLQLVVQEGPRETGIVDVPYEVRKESIFYPNINFTGLGVHYDTGRMPGPRDVIPTDIIPIPRPPDVVVGPSQDYDLHPSLFKKRRKRRRKYVFVRY